MIFFLSLSLSSSVVESFLHTKRRLIEFREQHSHVPLGKAHWCHNMIHLKKSDYKSAEGNSSNAKYNNSLCWTVGFKTLFNCVGISKNEGDIS